MTMYFYRQRLKWMIFERTISSVWMMPKVTVLMIILLTNGTCGSDMARDGEKIVEEAENLNTESHGTADTGNEIIIETKDRDIGIQSLSEPREQTESVIENDEKLSISDSEEINANEQKTASDKILEETPAKSSGEEALEKNRQYDTNTIESEIDGSNNDKPINTETNSTLLSWFKYFLDPFLEEFRDGIYSRTNQSNATDNASVLSNKTDILKVVNETMPPFLNLTELNTTDSSKKTKFQCTGKNVTDNTNATVKIVTSSRLLQLLNFDKNDTENVTDCLVVMFYAPWCLFCAKTAPHYNALSRAFPQLDFVAVDTAQFSKSVYHSIEEENEDSDAQADLSLRWMHSLLARFGTVSVPNILVFHQSRAAVKFNQTDRTFEQFVTFVKNTTGLEPNTTVNITDADYIGPISSVPTDDPDIFLWIAWMFVILYSSFMFIKSNKGQQWITKIRILWQEHQHID